MIRLKSSVQNASVIRDQESRVSTSLITFRETDHGQERRRQRGIDKKDLQRAMKYGAVAPGWPRPRTGNQTSVYTYKDITYIVDDCTGEEVTSYALPIKLDPINIDSPLLLEHDKYLRQVKNDLDCWTSHTVIVVDTSGSMKAGDMWGSRNRLGAVWMCLALDFVAQRLESGENKLTDIISIVTLSEDPTVILKEVPCSWVTYNKIVSIYNECSYAPSGHGPFLPVLRCAEKLLCRNKNAACAPALIFLSDGSPSDHMDHHIDTSEQDDMISEVVSEISRKLGRRLTFTAIGIGDKTQFKTLRRMVDVAKDYNVRAQLELPSFSSESIGIAFSTTVNSTLDTQRELTSMHTSKQRAVRDIERESKSHAKIPIRTINEKEFWIYPKHMVRRKIYNENWDGVRMVHSYENASLQNPEAEYVAFAKGPFGEGTERFAHRFYGIAGDKRTVVGKPMVAKESKFVLDKALDGVGDELQRKKFVRLSCKTQQCARRLSIKFNRKLDTIKRVHPQTPRVHFLDCYIYELDDIKVGTSSVLVEDRLDEDEWYKWNDNAGRVDGRFPPTTDQSDCRLVANGFRPVHDNLETLQEGSDDEDESEEEDSNDEETGDVYTSYPAPEIFSPSTVAQAFSHFTYLSSNRTKVVCDLQGIFDAEKNALMLSDPAIHCHYRHHPDRRCIYGDTDCGLKGKNDFFMTHDSCHGLLCSLVIRGFKNAA